MAKTKKRYRVSGQVTISVDCFVWARSEKEARKMASDADKQQFCYGCSSETCQDEDDGDPEWRTTGELDGEVKMTSIEECNE
jgi:hypothetical protein